MANTLTDVVLLGTVNMAGATTVHPEAGAVTNAAVVASAGIDYDKLDHYELILTNFDLPIGTTPAAREEIIFVARSVGVIQSFHAGLNENGSSTNIDFDLNVNGSTVLSAVVNVDHSDADRTNVAGTISSAALAVGDVVSVSLEDLVATTGAQGPFAVVGISYATPA